jgi:hypothetical protein
MTSSRKILPGEFPDDFGPWAFAHFQSRGARDEFLDSVALAQGSGWGAEALTGDARGARVRWRRGWFLRLNDLAYAHGGRIVLG